MFDASLIEYATAAEADRSDSLHLSPVLLTKAPVASSQRRTARINFRQCRTEVESSPKPGQILYCVCMASEVSRHDDRSLCKLFCTDESELRACDIAIDFGWSIPIQTADRRLAVTYRATETTRILDTLEKCSPTRLEAAADLLRESEK
jgi:hypothetical protein